MNVSRGLMALSAAAVVAAFLCMPVSASEPPAKSEDQAVADASIASAVTEATDASPSTDVSSASPWKARRVSARKRIVLSSRQPRAIVRQDVSWLRPRHERVAVVHWPIMLGIGF